MRRIAIAAALLVMAAPAVAAIGERIAAPVGGISIEKPAGWSVLPPDEALRNIRGIDFDTPGASRALRGPLITLTKYPLSHEGVVPTIKVNYHHFPAARELGPDGLAKLVIADLNRSLGEVKVLDAPSTVKVSGLSAGHFRVGYALRRGKQTADAVSEIWAVPRGNGFFMIGVGYSPDEPAATHGEIEAAVASVKIEAQ